MALKAGAAGASEKGRGDGEEGGEGEDEAWARNDGRADAGDGLAREPLMLSGERPDVDAELCEAALMSARALREMGDWTGDRRTRGRERFGMEDKGAEKRN